MADTVSREFVIDVIEQNRYLSMATTAGDDPWVAPVEYVVDDDLNFYFVSKTTSRHVGHIEQNPVVGVAIFDSTQPSMTGRGIQFKGQAKLYSEERNPFVIFDDRPDLPAKLPESNADYSAFSIQPTKFYVPVDDERVEVDMGL